MYALFFIVHRCAENDEPFKGNYGGFVNKFMFG